MLARSVASILLAALATRAALAQSVPPPPDLRAATARLSDAALHAHDAYDALGQLCDRVGHRLAGSAALDSAIAWAAARMRADGLQNVHTEPVMVPRWVRGAESAQLLEPRRRPLHVLGLGMSVGTPRGGITADVVVVDSFPQLEALGERALRGRIVLYDAPFRGYGSSVAYRIAGASRAARYGAVAVLVRSVTPASLDTPHTGTLVYADTLPKIPAAAITIEDAALLHRLAASGARPRVRLVLDDRRLPDVPSANVVGEVPGRERPDEVVAIGGHIDSWDVGQGAQDDGTGCVISMEAAHLMQRLGLRPRRTVRVVLWVNEENGGRGGHGYAAAHRAEAGGIVAAIESDLGNGAIQGFGLDLRPWAAPGDSVGRDTTGLAAARERALAALRAIAPLLEPLGASRMHVGGSGSDVAPLAALGVPALGAEHDAAHYFDIHHTEADTFDKVDPAGLAHNVAIMAVMAYALAEWPEPLRVAPR